MYVYFTYPESKSPSSLADFGANLRTFIAASVPRNTYIGSGGLLFAMVFTCFPQLLVSRSSGRLFSPRRYLLLLKGIGNS